MPGRTPQVHLVPPRAAFPARGVACLVTQDLLETSVSTAGPDLVIVLSGEADLGSAARLHALISDQLSTGIRFLTIDVSGLRYADSSSIRELLRAARTLRERGGDLLLLYPQPPVARLLELNAAGRLLTIRVTRSMASCTTGPDDSAAPSIPPLAESQFITSLHPAKPPDSMGAAEALRNSRLRRSTGTNRSE